MIKSVCIFCGSSSTEGKKSLFNKEHKKIAEEIGKELALRKIKITYGGAKIGLMGIMADKALKEKGQVLTEHIGSTDPGGEGETTSKNEEIYNRDIKWLQSADIVVAEVTTPSLGVGYELGIAEKLNIPVLC